MDIEGRLKQIKEFLAQNGHKIDPKTNQMIKELCSLCEELHAQASIDFLTGLYNRRFFEKELEINVEKAKRDRSVFSLILMDLDHFKKVNDQYGHLVGDEVLRKVAEIIKKNIRKIDIPARYGGEEFAVILPTTGSEGAFAVAKRLKRSINEALFGPKDKPFHITASMGVGTYRPLSGLSAEEFLAKVDKLLYQAKEAGRNCIVTDQEEQILSTEQDGITYEEREALKGVWQYDD
ncbi:diguanylate cyclase [Thermodesulfatator indicus DSM 15286]|uniref:diguanylate cyclase n=1 Tax=Thermodesulfatator indicus (strain DSM 15286 / JCM 11887 / CIR29812) TaxID=667014 RepID=F8A9V7_THEID|nr:GGDEF domain-containing protein [Thermodesulfatator indicus]AEH44155.1 diguanylate cyclase [Thermodesulfatator indicus DSM 15286]